MKKNTRIFLLVLLVVVFAYAFIMWANNSTIGGDAYASPPIDPEFELTFDFAIALLMNDSRAYYMIDPNLKPRLDQWMNSHKSQKCIGELTGSFITDGTNLGKMIKIGCFTGTPLSSFEVDDIVVDDMKVIDWGEVTEGD